MFLEKFAPLAKILHCDGIDKYHLRMYDTTTCDQLFDQTTLRTKVKQSNHLVLRIFRTVDAGVGKRNWLMRFSKPAVFSIVNVFVWFFVFWNPNFTFYSCPTCASKVAKLETCLTIKPFKRYKQILSIKFSLLWISWIVIKNIQSWRDPSDNSNMPKESL